MSAFATQLQPRTTVYTVERLDHTIVAKRGDEVLTSKCRNLTKVDPVTECAAAVLCNATHDPAFAKEYAPAFADDFLRNTDLWFGNLPRVLTWVNEQRRRAGEAA